MTRSVPSSSSSSVQQKKKRGPKGLCASGVSTSHGVVPLAQFMASAANMRALPVLVNKVGMTTPMPVPMGGVFDTAYKPADLNGPCDMCAKQRRPSKTTEEVAGDTNVDLEQEEEQEQEKEEVFHVLRATGRGCLPVGHGVYCSAACAQTAVFRHPAYKNWDDSDRFVSYQTMQRNPRHPVAYACALFHDSIYRGGRRTIAEVDQCKYRVQRASDQLLERELQQKAAVRIDPRQELFADFFKFTPEKIAGLLR